MESKLRDRLKTLEYEIELLAPPRGADSDTEITTKSLDKTDGSVLADDLTLMAYSRPQDAPEEDSDDDELFRQTWF